MQSMNKAFKIIDPHCHLWDLAHGYNGWLSSGESQLLGSLTAINKNYLPEDYLADTKEFTIEKIVHIEAASNHYAHQEVNWLTTMNFDLVGAIVAGIDLLNDEANELLSFYADNQLVTGVRQILNWHENPKYTMAERSDDLNNPLWQQQFQLLKKHNLSFDLQICPTQMSAAIALAKKYADIMIVIEHAGFPIPEELPIWKEGIAGLACCENVCIKLSGFAMLDHHQHKGMIKTLVDYVIEHFGVERCMFASNFPVDKLYQDFSTIYNDYFDIVKALSDSEIGQLFYNTAKRIYNID